MRSKEEEKTGCAKGGKIKIFRKANFFKNLVGRKKRGSKNAM